MAEFATVDSLADANVTAIELEIPVACLTQGKGTIIGGWTTASLPATRALGAVTPGLDGAQQVSGGYVQVSRLGMPLVNEVVIGLKDKNKFNNSEPKDDAQFADYVTNPTLPALLEILFGGAGVKAPTNFPRTDLVAAFLTGVQGLNQPPNVVASEMLRLDPARSIGVPASARSARGRQRRVPERPQTGRRRRRYRVARRDGRALHPQHRRLQAIRCARRNASLHRRRVHLCRIFPRAIPVPAASAAGLPESR